MSIDFFKKKQDRKGLELPSDLSNFFKNENTHINDWFCFCLFAGDGLLLAAVVGSGNWWGSRAVRFFRRVGKMERLAHGFGRRAGGVVGLAILAKKNRPKNSDDRLEKHAHLPELRLPEN